MKELIKQIYRKLAELSDLDLQRKLWLNENNDTGMISSYVELMCSLYDDFGFEDFIDKTASDIGLSESLISDLRKLDGLLRNYHELDADEAIINDPKWRIISKHANYVKSKWELEVLTNKALGNL